VRGFQFYLRELGVIALAPIREDTGSAVHSASLHHHRPGTRHGGTPEGIQEKYAFLVTFAAVRAVEITVVAVAIGVVVVILLFGIECCCSFYSFF
jgi:hypothetical protein